MGDSDTKEGKNVQTLGGGQLDAVHRLGHCGEKSLLNFDGFGSCFARIHATTTKNPA